MVYGLGGGLSLCVPCAPGRAQVGVLSWDLGADPAPSLYVSTDDVTSLADGFVPPGSAVVGPVNGFLRIASIAPVGRTGPAGTAGTDRRREPGGRP